MPVSEAPFNKVAGPNFIKKESLTQVFSSEFGEIFNNSFFTEHLRMVASIQFKSYPICALIP